MEQGEISNINQIGFAFTLMMAIIILIMRRRNVVAPIGMAGCYMTFGQIMMLMGLHFTILRILLAFSWGRLLIRRELNGVQINTIDKYFCLWVLSNVIIFTIQYQTNEAFINRLGFAYNALGSYFLFRFLIRNHEEVEHSLKIMAMIIVPLAILMLFEKGTGRNLFSYFGGVPELTMIRDEDSSLRAQGAFLHPILAGTFGATMFPIFTMLRRKGGGEGISAGIGMIASTIIVITSASSGPIAVYLFGILGTLAWRFRYNMKIIRWGILFGLIGLHIVMKVPVWFLAGRVSGILGGGSGYHRSAVLDAAVRHFDEWWLVGTHYTPHWLPYTLGSDPNMVDITNHYIGQGVQGGLLTMILFILIIVHCFRTIGRNIKKVGDGNRSMQMELWGLGAALFAHVMAFLSVAYFDQSVTFYYLLIAMISSFNMKNSNQKKDSAIFT